MSTLMFAECAAKCPPHAIVAVAAALIVGFVVGRLSKGDKCAAKKKGAGRAKSADRKLSPRPEPARQPIPAGSVEIYVGNLSYDLTEDELKKLFAEYGTVSASRTVFRGRLKRSENSST